ncbi:hypothetical protein V8C35DRAFT_318770 [Trichoderma chlorosporum]
MDLFNGDKLSLNQLGKIDILQWLQNGRDQKGSHTVADVDPIIEAGIQHLRISLGYHKIGVIGYYFGANMRAVTCEMASMLGSLPIHRLLRNKSSLA